MRRTFAAVFLAVTFGMPVVGQDENNAKFIRFDCEFSLKGEDGETDALGYVFKLYSQGNEHLATATGTGPFGGTLLVDVHLGDTGGPGITFLEMLPTGVVQTTTINASTLKAAHSRHTIMTIGNEHHFLPQQYYGECEFASE